MPKNSGPIRTATSVDFRLPESIFPVLGLMEIWTNMLLPVTPPRRIECERFFFCFFVFFLRCVLGACSFSHEHQVGCYFLNGSKDLGWSLDKIVRKCANAMLFSLQTLDPWLYLLCRAAASTVMKAFLFEQESLRIEKKPSPTMKFLPSSVANDAMGGTVCYFVVVLFATLVRLFQVCLVVACSRDLASFARRSTGLTRRCQC